jgi:glycosyltransferase involved in cell wall biosynthesis
MQGGIKIDVSVVIPTYNRLWCLPRAIDSCRDTACKTEIIVVDDGSGDGTWAWLQNQKDVRSFYQSNQGQTYAINYGSQQATGKYIRFLDSDDFLCPGMIDKQFEKAESTSANLVYSRVDYYDQTTGVITKLPDLEPWNDFLEVQLSNRYGSHFLGMLFNTDWTRKTPRRPEFSFREDRMFLLEYGLLTPRIEFVNGCAGYWVQHSSQMQANYNGIQSQVTNWQHLTLLKRIIYNLESTGRLTEPRKKAVCTVLWPLAHWMAIDFLDDATKVVDWIFTLDPDFKIPNKQPLRGLYKTLGFKRTELLLKTRRNLIHVFK